MRPVYIDAKDHISLRLYSRRVAHGGKGSNNADVMHREVGTSQGYASVSITYPRPSQILDTMLESARWSHLAFVWDHSERQELVQLWHKLNGRYRLAFKEVLTGDSAVRRVAG